MLGLHKYSEDNQYNCNYIHTNSGQIKIWDYLDHDKSCPTQTFVIPLIHILLRSSSGILLAFAMRMISCVLSRDYFEENVYHFSPSKIISDE